MYRSKGSSSHSYKKYQGGGNQGGNQRRSYGGGGGKRKQASFDPSMLVQKAVFTPPKMDFVSQNTFESFEIHADIKQTIIKRGYIQPTPIQDQIIPHVLAGRDVVGLAGTGTGKTAAFLIPLIHHLHQKTAKRVLIMAPTRELAVQIHNEFKVFAAGLNLQAGLCIGGASMFRQIEALRRNPVCVIGTPGRLLDLEKRRILNFDSFSAIVLDEVDQMLDMGFVNDMKYVISRLPEKRHSLFFSATLPYKLEEIVQSFLKNPIKVAVETQKASANVNQDVIRVTGQSKIDVLHDLLSQEGFDKVLVFGRTKHGLDKLSRVLFDRGLRVAAIHGNKTQYQRQRSLQQFQDNQVQVLLATDIASRGLDIDDVTHVINFDLPQTYEDYIHRIGRTGRGNKTGIALSFVE